VSRLFGAYVIVDWSAAEGKKTGESSVWIGVVKRDVRFRLSYESYNPSTRLDALGLLKTIVSDLHKRGDRVFLGFDFSLGFPRGTVTKLGLTGTPWEAMWEFLIKNIVDKPDNTNNRFAVAAKMNRLMTDDAYPFWGCPKSSAQKWLSTLKPQSFGDFPEHRFTEMASRKLGKHAQAKSNWQMHGAGVVGGQAMLGIPVVRQLRTQFTKARIWPFETGFAALNEEILEGVDLVMAEVYPSLYPGPSEGIEPKDATQVRLTANALAEFDDKGQLAMLFAAPKDLDEAELLIAAEEEGWILGVT
jgi:hypothetical protein